MREQSADDRTDDKPDAENRPEHAHIGSAFLVRLGQIGHIALRDGQIAGCHAVNDAANEQRNNVSRSGKHKPADSGAGDAGNQSRPATETIRQTAQNRRAQK